MDKLFANTGDPDQMPHSAVSDLGLHCLPNTLLGVSRLKWVKLACKGKLKSVCLKQVLGHLFNASKYTHIFPLQNLKKSYL